jgi:hypothetical protein
LACQLRGRVPGSGFDHHNDNLLIVYCDYICLTRKGSYHSKPLQSCTKLVVVVVVIAFPLSPLAYQVPCGQLVFFLSFFFLMCSGALGYFPWPGGGSFLGKNPPPSVRFEPTSAGTATSEHYLRQPCGHRATLHQTCLMGPKSGDSTVVTSLSEIAP